MDSQKRENALYVAWGIALVATLASLFLSEVMNVPPCVLCWYQRISMYPLVVILLVGILKKDEKVWYYALPFAVAGMLVAIYHSLLQAGIIPETLAPCAAGISCTQKAFNLLGFVTAPLISFLSFAGITFCLAVYHKKGPNNEL